MARRTPGGRLVGGRHRLIERLGSGDSGDVGSRGIVQVRLTQGDRAPRSPMAQAQPEHVDWGTYDREVRTQCTRTSFQGHEAVLADTTGGPGEPPSRLVQLLIRTDDGRMCEMRELSVHMPKGGPGEKHGTAVFKSARDRLEIGAVRSSTP
ncbi:hypothetical protein [Streptomyces incanus]|uniref:Uncharacterized protein n=1 Tax=Streptomyces incanus TaxID=887453 RepID=A0ABW0XN99_9ACTN